MSPDRSIQPAIHDAIDFDYRLPPINEERLANGLPLYWLSAGVQDVVEVDFVFSAGIWQEIKPAVAQATAGLLKNGTTTRSAQQIHESIEFYGATLKVAAGNDWSTVSLYCLSRHLPQLLPIVQDVLQNATFPEDEVALHKQNAIQRLLVNLRQCEFVANQRIDALLFGESHPYGRYAREEKISAITQEDLKDFYKKHYRLNGMRIFMAGRIGDAEVKLINDHFGRLSPEGGDAPEVAFAAPGPSDNVQRITNDPNGVQGAIRIGRVFPNRLHPDFPMMVVLNTLFGGYFGSRLMSNIREDKGYTYGIYSSINSYQKGGSLIIHTEAGRDVCEAAVAEIYKEMETLRTEPVDAEELLLVKNYLLGGLLGDLDGPFQILQRWRTLILNGLGKDHFDRNIAVYKAATSEDLLQMAGKYLQREDFYEIVVV